jgi:hypothetical protein
VILTVFLSNFLPPPPHCIICDNHSMTLGTIEHALVDMCNFSGILLMQVHPVPV